MFLQSIHNFRALAIIFIVAGHCFPVAEIASGSKTELVLKNLVLGGTTMFVFVSGFLFYHVFSQNFVYRDFLLKKIKFILLPYLVLGSAPLLYAVIVQLPYWGGVFLPRGDGFFYEYLLPAIQYLVTGRFLTAYWFIPFVMTMFLLSPLYMLFLRIGLKWQLTIIIFGLVMSALIHRPLWNMYVPQAVVYFMPVYLFGILCGQYRERVYCILRDREWILLLAVVGLAVFQSDLGLVGSYNKAPFQYAGTDLQLFQKVLMSLMLFSFLHRFECFSARWIDVVAATSFAIYFLHSHLLLVVWSVSPSVSFIGTGAWLEHVLLTIFVVGACSLFAVMVSRLSGKNSRYFLGY